MPASVPSDSGAEGLPQLSEAEARRRLLHEGPNQVASEAPQTFLRAAWRVVRQPMFLLLLTACGLTLALGSAEDALTLSVFVLVVMGLTLYQDRRSERAVAKLRDLTAPTADVVRDAQRHSLPSRDLVPGDLVALREGARVPADALVLRSTNLAIDESLLTGESVPVQKLPAASLDALLAPPGSDADSSVYGGTLVVAGSAYASVRATGARSAIGGIGRALATIPTKKSALARDVERWVTRIAGFGGGLCLLLVFAYAWIEGDLMRGLLSAITLAMAILPEELPVVLAVFTTLGAFRVAKHGVLARRPETLESLGSASVLCVDKTGTITENRMRVAALQRPQEAPFVVPEHAEAIPGDALVLPEAVHEVLEFALLASADTAATDPMERAIGWLAGRTLIGTEHIHRDYTREQEYPLTSELFSVSHLFRTEAMNDHVVAAKGAPEAIFDLCHLPSEEIALRMAEVSELAARGYRVLAVARARFVQEEHPPKQHDFEFALVGFVGFEDPVRASVPGAVRAFRAAGARVVMITGDHAVTARAIAERAQLDVQAGVLTGPVFAGLSPEAQADAARRVNVFARATPEHKLLLVQALQRGGDLVAMTGDGVNDAPALKAADIGIALGLHGTDVAREAASLVLTTEDFGAIAQAIMVGRRIFENLRKAATYIIAVHVPIAGLSLVPVFVGLPTLLLPVHVVFLQLIIDPACALVFEAEPPEEGSASAKPRAQGARLLESAGLWRSFLQGAVLFVAVLLVYRHACGLGLSAEEARATAFIALVVGNVALVTVQRSRTRASLSTLLSSQNGWASALSLGALLALGVVLAVPLLRELFHFALPAPQRAFGAAVWGLASVLWYDGVKLVSSRRRATSGP